MAGSRELFLQNGFNDFISKPLASEQLNSALNRWLPPELFTEERQKPRQLDLSPEEGALMKQLSKIADLDIEEGLKFSNNSFAAYKKSLEWLVKNLPSEIRNLKNEALNGDWKLLGIKAHALKGIFASIGAQRQSIMARTLETEAREGNLHDISADGEAFADAAMSLYRQLDPILPGEEAAEDKPPLDEEMRARLVEFCASLESRKIENIRNLYAIPEEIDRLLESFDYDQAATLLSAAQAAQPLNFSPQVSDI
jgi:HPt (histidine-containing phosphotransfer) domain-containing protein